MLRMEYIIPIWCVEVLLGENDSGLPQGNKDELFRFLQSVPKNGVWSFDNKDTFYAPYNAVNSVPDTCLIGVYNIEKP